MYIETLEHWDKCIPNYNGTISHRHGQDDADETNSPLVLNRCATLPHGIITDEDIPIILCMLDSVYRAFPRRGGNQGWERFRPYEMTIVHEALQAESCN